MSIDGCAIAYTDVGIGPALLFVHTGLWSLIWRDVIVQLSHGFRCICLDAPGTGRSGSPSDGISIDGSTRSLAGLVEGLELRDATLVVHDLGGLTGVAALARSAVNVRAIVAINAFAWRPEGRALRTMLSVAGSPAIRELDVLTGLIPRITATRFGVGRHLDRASRRAFRRALGHRGVRAFHGYLHDALRCELLHVEADAALHRRFARLSVLTIFGERNDPFHFQAGWRDRFPRAIQRVIPRGNHFPMCDDPEFVAQCIARFTGLESTAEAAPVLGQP